VAPSISILSHKPAIRVQVLAGVLAKVLVYGGAVLAMGAAPQHEGHMNTSTPYRHDDPGMDMLVLSILLYYHDLSRAKEWLTICTWPQYEASCWN